MKITRRQLIATVLAGPVGAKLTLAAQAGQKLPRPHTSTGLRHFGVQLAGPLPQRFGSIFHLECVVLPGLCAIRDMVEREGKGKPIRFLEPEMSKAVEYCRLYVIGPMKVREAWAWDPWPSDGSAPHFVGRLDAIVQIG